MFFTYIDPILFFLIDNIYNLGIFLNPFSPVIKFSSKLNYFNLGNENSENIPSKSFNLQFERSKT